MSRKSLNSDEQVTRYMRHVDRTSMSKTDQLRSGKIGYRAHGTLAKRAGDLKRSIRDVFAREGIHRIKDVTHEMVQRQVDHLRGRGLSSGTIHGHAKALSDMHFHFRGEPVLLDGLPTRDSDAPTDSRAYTPEQVQEISRHQVPEHALMTEIAHAAGLRASELSTLRPASEFPAQIPQHRLESLIPDRWGDSEGHTAYVATGKGGLEREVMIPDHLADRLEAYRLDEPREVHSLRGEEDRTLESHYGLPHHEAWGRNFTETSQELFGYSHGPHGLRHSFAQRKYREGGGEQAKEAVSQCLGHFRPGVTDKYLR